MNANVQAGVVSVLLQFFIRIPFTDNTKQAHCFCVDIFWNLITENWVNLFSSTPLTFIEGRYITLDHEQWKWGKCSRNVCFHWEGTKTSHNQRRYCFPIFLHTWHGRRQYGRKCHYNYAVSVAPRWLSSMADFNYFHAKFPFCVLFLFSSFVPNLYWQARGLLILANLVKQFVITEQEED